jgi:hypothetical protein
MTSGRRGGTDSRGMTSLAARKGRTADAGHQGAPSHGAASQVLMAMLYWPLLPVPATPESGAQFQEMQL